MPRDKSKTTTDDILKTARALDPWAWTSHAFGTSDQDLARILKERREVSVVNAKKAINDAKI
jgi:hypothetical protein